MGRIPNGKTQTIYDIQLHIFQNDATWQTHFVFIIFLTYYLLFAQEFG